MQPQSSQVAEWKFPIFLFKYKKVESLPAFHSPILRKIIVELSWIKSISKISDQTYPCLQQYTLKFNKKLSHICLVDAPNLQTIQIQKNYFDVQGQYFAIKSRLTNTKFFKKYENLKEAYIQKMIFSDPVEGKDEEQQPQIQKPEDNEQVAQKQGPKKSELQRLINPKKYQQYLQNHLGTKQENQQTYSYKVQFKQNVIKILPEFRFKYIKELLCANNFVSSLQQFAKGSYPTLKIIDLSKNKIQYVPPLSIPQVQNLNLSQNQIKSVDHFATGQYPKLQSLFLDNNQLKSLPKLNTISLKNIHLFKNKLSNVDDFFSGQYPEIEKLQIISQQLKTIKEINCPNLQYLDFSCNQLQSIPILNTPLIKQLILAGNKIVDTINLKNDKISLEHINLQKNKIQILHIFCTSKLQRLNFSFNPIRNFHQFAQLQFPLLQSLYINGHSSRFCKYQHNLIVPKLKMPLIKILNFNDFPTYFQDDFFEGVYQNLKQIKFGECQNLTKLYKINAPQLAQIRIYETKISDITDFLATSYPSLSCFELPKNLKFILDQKNKIQQLIIDRKTPKPIVPLYISVNQTFKRLLFSSFLTEINLDCELIQSIQFISFLNLTHCQSLKCKNVKTRAIITKNLAKINFEQSTKIKKISLQTQQNLNIVQFSKFSCQKQCVFIENDSYWRRSYKAKDPIKWQIVGRQTAGGWIKNDKKLDIADFEKRLAGYNHRNIIKNLKKRKCEKLQRKSIIKDMFNFDMRQRSLPLIRPQRNYMQDEFDDFEDINFFNDKHYHDMERYQRNIREDFYQREQQTEWRSPRMIRSGYDRRPQRSYPFTNISAIHSHAKGFFCQLQCPLAEAYLGEGHYWFFEKIGMCGDAPTFFVRTIDGGTTQFMVSFGMIKVSQMGVEHFFQRKYNQVKSEVCIDCLIEVDRLMRQIFQIQGQTCPLDDRQQNIQGYRQMAHLTNTD